MLAEMSTPLIPITDRIMVMPLVGAMDTDRAEQAVETALRGVQAQKAQVVIVDITGIKNISTNVSSILIRMAQALHLLGAQAVLTGIRAEVAAGLVSLGVDLRGIVTRSTLQAGIAYALSRVKAQGFGDLR
jgi:rsbT co-antagonist protein RsbR